MSIDPLLVLALLSLDVVIAEWLGRVDLVLPAILIGSIVTAVGTYLGVLVTGLLC